MGVKFRVCFLLIRPVVGKKVIIVLKFFSQPVIQSNHIKILKYILGVNRKTTNIAVMSELGRYPIYFSVILAMLKYCHRLEGQQECLLFDAYVCNKELLYILVKSIHGIPVYYILWMN
jgi:hypothetical protein